MDLFAGSIVALVGVAVAGAGLPLYLIILPLSGFMVGFFAGAAITVAVFGGGFLASTLALFVAIAIGLLFAFGSYLYWYASVLIIFGMGGFVLGASLFGTLGIRPDWLLFILAVAVAAVFFIAAAVSNFPVFFIVAGTAFFGSAMLIGGLLVAFGQFDRTAIGSGETWRAIGDNPLLWLAWLAIAVMGIASQVSMIKRATLPGDKWARITQQ